MNPGLLSQKIYTMSSHKNLSSMKPIELYALGDRFNLTLDSLIKKYGPRFTLKLTKTVAVFEKKPSAPKSVPFLEPYNIRNQRRKVLKARIQIERNAQLEKVLEEKLETLLEEYTKLVTQAGFKIKTRGEDFVDENTGEIVTVERKEFFCLYLTKNPA